VLHFVPLRLNHLPLMTEWFARPHLKQWWTRGETFTLAQIVSKYGSRARGEDPAKGFVIEQDNQPIGYVQYYPVADDSLPDGVLSPKNRLFTAYKMSELAGVDLLLADPERLGKGMGTQVLKDFLDKVIFPQFRVAVIDPLRVNERAIRSFEKSGFRVTEFSEVPATVVMVAVRP
jgi:aminoglycoside 6'-N-acetyltransferase